MTLEQKIEELKSKSEQNRAMAKEKEICELSGRVSKYIHSVVEFNKIAEDCDQLASWLTELKDCRKTMEHIKKHYILVEKSPKDNPNELIIRKAFGEGEAEDEQ